MEEGVVKMIATNVCYNEDCVATMSRLPNDSIDMVLTSPPYDSLRKYSGYSFNFERVAPELFRVIKKGGVLVWVVADATIDGSESGSSFRQVLRFKELGFNIHDTMIWRKPNPVPTQHTRYQQAFEYMFVLSVGKPTTFNPVMTVCKHPGGRRKKHRARLSAHTDNDEGFYTYKSHKIMENVWDICVGNKQKNHPAVFPEELARRHIISWSNDGELVYDPFMGSGTTARVASANNRRWLGSEISQEYHQLILSQISR